MANDFLQDPYQVHVGSLDLRANKDITQIVEVVGNDYEKYPRLLHHMRNFNDGSRVIVFVETKKGCDQLTRSLRGEGMPIHAIHGDKSQQERDQVLEGKNNHFFRFIIRFSHASLMITHTDFRRGKCLMLSATDVAARGLDIKDVSILPPSFVLYICNMLYWVVYSLIVCAH